MLHPLSPERNATNPKPALGLPTTLTSLFDLSYLYPTVVGVKTIFCYHLHWPATNSWPEHYPAISGITPANSTIYVNNEGKTFVERLHLLSDKSESSTEPQSETTEAGTPERTSSATNVDTQNRGGRKVVHYEMIPGVTDGWDKMPALSANIVAVESYKGAVERLREAWMA